MTTVMTSMANECNECEAGYCVYDYFRSELDFIALRGCNGIPSVITNDSANIIAQIIFCFLREVVTDNSAWCLDRFRLHE